MWFKTPTPYVFSLECLILQNYRNRSLKTQLGSLKWSIKDIPPIFQSRHGFSFSPLFGLFCSWSSLCLIFRLITVHTFWIMLYRLWSNDKWKSELREFSSHRGFHIAAENEKKKREKCFMMKHPLSYFV